MTNREIARIFSEIADILDIKGENPFKIRAYRRAVEHVETSQTRPTTLSATLRGGISE